MVSTVTIKLKFKPQNDDQMTIESEVNNTSPKEKLPSGVMDVDEENRLHLSDPRQKEMKFRLIFTNLQDALESHFEEIVQSLEEKTGEIIVRGTI